MAQHLQLQWGSLCHYSRQTCWTRISAGSRSVAWKYLFVTFLHGITLPMWPGVHQVLYGRRHRVPVYFLLSLLCVALIVPWGSWEEALCPATLLQSVCDPSWWLGSTGVLGDASAVSDITLSAARHPSCLPSWLCKALTFAAFQISCPSFQACWRLLSLMHFLCYEKVGWGQLTSPNFSFQVMW